MNKVMSQSFTFKLQVSEFGKSNLLKFDRDLGG